MHDNQVILGIDFGTNHWGLAIGQTALAQANGLQAISVEQGWPSEAAMKKVLTAWRVHAIVMGLPLNMDGSEQPITAQVRQVAQWLQQTFHLPVHLQDERLTTVEAKAQLFAQGGYRALKKDNIDVLSAVMILEDWLSKSST